MQIILVHEKVMIKKVFASGFLVQEITQKELFNMGCYTHSTDISRNTKIAQNKDCSK
jgi:hypothetical protein